MAKIMGEVMFPARMEKQVIGIKCDLCGKGSEWQRADWSKDQYEVHEIEIKRKIGTNYPEGGNGTEETFDVCPECWETKLVPWMQSQGAVMTIRKWDW